MNRQPDLHVAAKWAPAIVCCLLVGIILAGFAWYAGQTRAIVEATRETQVANTNLNQQTNANTTRLKKLLQEVIEGNERIKDCTEPGGECFKRSQAAQAQVLDFLTLRIIYIATCRPNNPSAADVPQILECVHQLEQSKAGLTVALTAHTGQDRVAVMAALQKAIDDAIALSGTDAGFDKTLAAKAAGMCRAIQIRRPKWWRFENASNPLLTWVHNHPPPPSPKTLTGAR